MQTEESEIVLLWKCKIKQGDNTTVNIEYFYYIVFTISHFTSYCSKAWGQVLLNLSFYLSEDPVKNLMVCIKILSSTVLNIDHKKKHILTSKSAY